jgi:hypothetical protein
LFLILPWPYCQGKRFEIGRGNRLEPERWHFSPGIRAGFVPADFFGSAAVAAGAFFSAGFFTAGRRFWVFFLVAIVSPYYK